MKKAVIAAAVVAFAVVGLANSVKKTAEQAVRKGLAHTELQIEAASK